MKTKSSSAKQRVSSKSLIGKLDGAATTARRKAFKLNLPVAIFEDGKFYLVYRGKKKIEVSPEEFEKMIAK